MQNNEITLVTTVKDRWLFLKESLKTWVNKNFYEIIIVDWGSKDVKVSDEIKKEYKDIKIIEVTEDITSSYLGSVARNISIDIVKSDYIFFIDCDIKIMNDNVDDMIDNEKDFYHGHISTTGAHTNGSCIVSKKMIEEVNGYSEDLGVLPIEDRDLYRRLKMRGYKEGYFNKSSIVHIDHSYEDRFRYRFWKEDFNIVYTKWDKTKVRRKISYNVI